MKLTMTKLEALSEDISLERAIKDLINEHDIKHMDEGEDYYHNENHAVMSKQRYYYDENKEKRTDKTKINRKIPHSWQKILVDQKTSYLVGEPPNIQAESEQFDEKLNELLDEDFADDLQELSKGASNKGVEWLHVYIDNEEEGINKLKYTIIPAQEVIPIWDSQHQKELEAVIRYYYVWHGTKQRKKVEYHDKEGVIYYMEAENGELIPDGEENSYDEEGNVVKTPHFYRNGQEESWGKVPFIPFKNNEEMKGDLTYYKALIDEYDLTQSNHADNLAEVQDIIWVLKNYQGTSLAEFQENLRFHKAMKTDGEGGAEVKQTEVPSDAKEKHLQRISEDIFLFGMGIDFKTDKFGQSPSGVALKFMYSLLDLKADIMARKFKRSIKDFIWFLTEYLRLAGEGDYRNDKVTITFNKSKIMNEAEQVQMANQSKGVISDDTILANHPWVEDVEAEKEKIEQQQEDIVNLDDLEAQQEGEEE